MKNASAPAHLAAKTRAWWDAVLKDYELEPHHLRLLQIAGESWDRTQQARLILAKDGLTIPTADGGLKAHPAVAIERDARLAFTRLVRELDLDCEPTKEAPRAPTLRSNRRQ